MVLMVYGMAVVVHGMAQLVPVVHGCYVLFGRDDVLWHKSPTDTTG